MKTEVDAIEMRLLRFARNDMLLRFARNDVMQSLRGRRPWQSVIRKLWLTVIAGLIKWGGGV